MNLACYSYLVAHTFVTFLFFIMNKQLRKSWDTSVKLLFNLGLEDRIPDHLLKLISATNKHRWRNEASDKYLGCEIHQFIDGELKLYHRIGSTNRVKKLNKAYFKLEDTLMLILNKVKAKKKLFNQHKDLIVNVIEQVKDNISIDRAIRMFGISRTTYQHYKSLVMSKCDRSMIYYCLRKYPQQLLKQEVKNIENYMNDEVYRYWSSSSVYAIALKENAVSCCLSTWYKYCNLLGLVSKKISKTTDYHPLVTFRPNQYWCADATRFVTNDGNKYWIHFLMDHYSRKILGFNVAKSPSKYAIKKLLEEAYKKYRPDKPLILLTDGGSENINNHVKQFLHQPNIHIIHRVAQKDETFSNSMIEAFNKTFKQEFLNPIVIKDKEMLIDIIPKLLETYNCIRPQYVLDCNTPNEVYEDNYITLNEHKAHFDEFRLYRKQQNNKNRCLICI